jgi:hypothetical protein
MSVKPPVRAAPSPSDRTAEVHSAIRANATNAGNDDAPPVGLGDKLRARAAPSKPKAPEDTDERLATFLRGPEGDPARVELRVSWCLYNTGAYLRLHSWQRGDDGQFWPVKGAAVTIRRRELGAFAEALAGALDRSDALGRAQRR